MGPIDKEFQEKRRGQLELKKAESGLFLLLSPYGWTAFISFNHQSPSIQSKLRGTLYSKGYDEKRNNTDKKIQLSIKDKILL